MSFPQIRLSSTSAAIQINTTSGKMEIEQPPAKLDIQQPQAKLEMERRPAKLTIDQTEARADVDLKSVFRRTRDAAELGRQDWLQGLARLASDGDELMMIESGSGPIADQAKRNSEDPMQEINIGWVPSHGSVKISYEPGEVKINVEPQKVRNNSKAQKPVINYTPAHIKINLSRYNELKIDFENLRHVGINFEITI
ncbi:DUF6470 family protein [Bacillus sp. SCS-153A]|uniref:DUF6470 family protein n=1 Tax=Rossellomorea sedimentorum TaxID=3115294 RepID=UPI003906028A